VVFLLTEADIKDDSFLEQVNALLATGEVPGLFPRDELVAMASELRGAMQRECPDRADTLHNLTSFFHDRVRRNLHVVLCLSLVSTVLKSTPNRNDPCVQAYRIRRAATVCSPNDSVSAAVAPLRMRPQ
jgi:hypothetical protein